MDYEGIKNIYYDKNMQFTDPNKKTIIATLGFILEGENILLGMKKRGFGEGKWNGFGGKVEVGETFHEAMIREFKEECGVVVTACEKRGEVYFELDHEDFNLVGHVFVVTEYEGNPCETEEMRPEWYAQGDIPYNMMWEDDRYWLPILLKGDTFKAFFKFANHDTILTHYITSL